MNHCRRERVDAPCMPITTVEKLPLGPNLELLWLELTKKCNLRCWHCYADSGPRLPLHGEMQMTDWKRVMDVAFAAGCRQVQFSGGEATLHPFLLDLLTYAACSSFSFLQVFSNGTCLDLSFLRTMKRTGACLAVSVYGPDALRHDRRTAVKGSFDRTIRNIDLAMTEGVRVDAGIISFDDDASAARDAADFLRDRGVKLLHIRPVLAAGRGENLQAAPHSCGHCGRGILAISPDGIVRPCGFARSRVLSTVWDIDWLCTSLKFAQSST